MTHYSAPPVHRLIDLDRAAAITGLSSELINHLVILHLLTPAAMARDGEPLFSAEQTFHMEILDAMNSLNFGLEQMRDIVRVTIILDTEPATRPTEHCRMRLGMFLQFLARRAVTSQGQLAARAILISTLQQRYSWLA